MQEAPVPHDEEARLEALRSYEVLDTEPEPAYDDLTRIAAQICATPVSLVSLLDAERQWFKSHHGLDATETPRNVAFCAHAILEPGRVFVVSDAFEDERFHDNPLVVGPPNVRAYAGAPLVDSAGNALGTLCVIDHAPRRHSDRELDALRALSRQAAHRIESRRSQAALGELQRELHGANEELRQLSFVAAHDLREPLRKLLVFSDLLKRDLGEELPSTAQTDLHHIVESARRMDHVVRSLLELSNASRTGLERARASLAECATAAIDSLHARIDVLGARVEVAPLPQVEGDPALLVELFRTLIENALKFTDGHPVVDVSCTVEDDREVVTVRDNGIGVDPRYTDKIFEPFQRLHPRGAFEGSGIGLAIARKIVRRHGGRIWVESVPGRGSRFRFTLRG